MPWKSTTGTLMGIKFQFWRLSGVSRLGLKWIPTGVYPASAAVFMPSKGTSAQHTVARWYMGANPPRE